MSLQSPSGFLEFDFKIFLFFDFLTVATRSPWMISIFHSKVSPPVSLEKKAMPSGMIALSDFDLNLAIDVFDYAGTLE